VEEQRRGHRSEVIDGDEAEQAAGVEHGEGDGVAVAGGEGADEE